jgi:ergothioneine biosynthesis protein EgtB
MATATLTTPPAADSSQTLAAEYERIRSASIGLAAQLSPEDQVVQSMPEVSPTKWHLAHVTWFFERFCLRGHAPDYSPLDDRYDHLFNSYYYTVGEMHRRPQRGLLSRPTVAEIHAYREHVDHAMLALIARHVGDEEFEFLVRLGLNHEQQHQELLLTDIKHVFSVNPIGPVYRHADPQPATTAMPMRFVDRPGGIFEIGAEAARFCFDNETPRHRVLVDEHSIGNRLVTNGEYRQFIDDGAYAEPKLWLSDGWATIRERGWNRPLYWSDDDEREFTLAGWQPIDAGAPVSHVSFYEADAFARWAGARLPTEIEWELAATESEIDGNLLDTGRLHPAALAAGEPSALHQLFGDVWEWTASSYAPYPDFEPLAGSLGEYNGKFMCNQMVVRGGSCATWRDHLRATYRSFFYPRDRWQFLGFRLARSRK